MGDGWLVWREALGVLFVFFFEGLLVYNCGWLQCNCSNRENTRTKDDKVIQKIKKVKYITDPCVLACKGLR